MWQDAHAAAVGLTGVAARTAHAASPAPTWAIAVGIGLGVLLATLVLWCALVATRQPPRGDGDDDRGSGPGGGGPGRPGPDGGDAPGGAPTWWPDFERDFATHVSEREATEVSV
jgi:hypothetical protein